MAVAAAAAEVAVCVTNDDLGGVGRCLTVRQVALLDKIGRGGEAAGEEVEEHKGARGGEGFHGGR